MNACGPAPAPRATHTIETGRLAVWSVYPGTLESRRVEIIMSKFQGTATIVELAPEGQPVRAGDLLVRFDSSQVERDLLKLQRDFQLARADLERLEKAEQPLELGDLEAQRLEAQAAYEAERRYLEDSRALLDEELVSEQEIEQQNLKVEQLRAALDKLDQRIALTREFLHPAARERARATLATAEQELALARRQLEHCVVHAPADGVVVYKPLHVGGEFRTVRVGDTLYRNQPFMILPDMGDLVIDILVPEAELARVEPGREAVVTPLSYPDLKLRGRVETVGSMATTAMERPGWQRYFRAQIGLLESDPRLRSGMSVQAEILSYSAEQAVLLPRVCVRMEGGTPTVRLASAPDTPHRVKLGWADLRHFEVLEGLRVGDKVLLP
jgi:multidrug resistance efflux pump